MKCETGRIHAKKRYSSGFIMIYTVTVSLFGLTPDCGKHQAIGGVPIPQELHLSVVRPHCLRRFHARTVTGREYHYLPRGSLP